MLFSSPHLFLYTLWGGLFNVPLAPSLLRLPLPLHSERFMLRELSSTWYAGIPRISAFPVSDGHSRCNCCLRYPQIPAKCKICSAVKRRACKNWRLNLGSSRWSSPSDQSWVQAQVPLGHWPLSENSALLISVPANSRPDFPDVRVSRSGLLSDHHQQKV